MIGDVWEDTRDDDGSFSVLRTTNLSAVVKSRQKPIVKPSGKPLTHTWIVRKNGFQVGSGVTESEEAAKSIAAHILGVFNGGS